MKYKVTYIFYFKDKKSGVITSKKVSRTIEDYNLQETIKSDLKRLNEKYPERYDYCYTKELLKENA